MRPYRSIAIGLAGVSVAIFGLSISIIGQTIAQVGSTNIGPGIFIGAILAALGVTISFMSALTLDKAGQK